MHTIFPEIFRAYDIRGVVGETLTNHTVEMIGKAVGSMAREVGETSVIIARDGRLSGPELLECLSLGLQSAGCDVIEIGAVPTPVLYYATNTLSTKSGIMLTGSHNPPNYNGLKIVVAGKTLSEGDIQVIYDRIIKNDFLSGNGKKEVVDVASSYINRILGEVTLQKRLKIVVDCGNGVAGKIAPELFTRLGCEVIPLFEEVDGHFPGHHPDPSIPENLEDLIFEVKEKGADIGLAFDGDGDRLGVVTDKGKIIWPDRQLMLYAIDVLRKNPGATILYDVKCTKHLFDVIQDHGGIPVMGKTGHSLVKAKMKEIDAKLAGEMSGHVFFNDRWYGFDDGLYCGVRLLEILAGYKLTADELFQSIPESVSTPEMKVSIDEDKKFQFMDQLVDSVNVENGKVTTIDGLRIDYPDGWGLVRPSNTTPCLVLRFEADTEEALERIKEEFYGYMLAIKPELKMPS